LIRERVEQRIGLGKFFRDQPRPHGRSEIRQRRDILSFDALHVRRRARGRELQNQRELGPRFGGLRIRRRQQAGQKFHDRRRGRRNGRRLGRGGGEHQGGERDDGSFGEL